MRVERRVLLPTAWMVVRSRSPPPLLGGENQELVAELCHLCHFLTDVQLRRVLRCVQEELNLDVGGFLASSRIPGVIT